MTGCESGGGAAPGICRACRTRDCCRRAIALRGDDVVGIARALQVNPDHFAVLAPVEESAPAAADHIHLGPGAERYRLLLRRRETEPGRGDEVCTFLLELRDGRRLCGLAELAPVACHLFPRVADGGLHKGPGCWRAWTDEEAPRDPVAEAGAAAAHVRWQAILAAWNAQVSATERQVPGATFLEHLFTAYA